MKSRQSDEIEWDLESIFEHVLRRMHPSSPPPSIHVEFHPFAGMNHTVRLRDGRLLVRLSDLMRGSSPRMIEAIAVMLLGRLFRRAVPAEVRKRYSRYVHSSAMRQKILEARRHRGRAQKGTAGGKFHDLTQLFDGLNQRYFDARLLQPQLGWTRAASASRLGRYDQAHNAIVLSRLLDQERVPRVLVEWILYHEMLHVKHPVEHCGGRRKVHSPAFRREEKMFHGYHEARAALAALLV